jgi:peptidoglycan/LPS O-acetylase OafA/YrhL
MVYYLAWPVFLAWGRFRISAAFRAAGLITAVVVAVSGGVWKVGAGGRPDHWLIPIWTTAAAFIWWLAGAAVIEHWNVLTRLATPRRCAWLLPLSTLPVAGAFLVGALGARTWVGFLAIYGCIPFFCLLVLAGRHCPWLETRRGARVASFCGLASFPVYVFHDQVIALLAPLLAGIGSGRSQLGFFVTLTTAVFLVCGVAGAVLESYLLTVRARFLKRMRPPRSASRSDVA